MTNDSKQPISVPRPDVYLDYAATTPVDPRVVAAMTECLSADGAFGNPASRSHRFGWDAEAIVESAREHIAAVIGCDRREVIWTSGATESDNLAIKGVAEFYGDSKGRHIVTSNIEHKAVLDPCRELERKGYEVTYINPDKHGIVQPDAVAQALRDDTCLVSVMHVNNEIGSMNDIAAIGALCRQKGVLFHVDAAQSAGKIPIDLAGLPVDLMSLSAHKMYGPKGIGALFVRRRPRVRLGAQIHGGGHERGMRAGTLPTHQIAGFGEACRIAKQEMHANAAQVKALRTTLLATFADMEAVQVNGHPTQHLPHIVNISFNYVEGESLIMAIKGIALSSGSACTSASLEPSYVLRALGVPDEIAHSSLRFSLSHLTTSEQAHRAGEEIRHAVSRLRELSPLWDMYKDGVDMDAVEWSTH